MKYFIIVKLNKTPWPNFVFILEIQMKTVLDLNTIVLIENKQIDETNRLIRKSDPKYLS